MFPCGAFRMVWACGSGIRHCSIVVCPATVQSNWVRELNAWAPRMRVFVMHPSGSTIGGTQGRRDLSRNQSGPRAKSTSSENVTRDGVHSEPSPAPSSPARRKRWTRSSCRRKSARGTEISGTTTAESSPSAASRAAASSLSILRAVTPRSATSRVCLSRWRRA